MNINKMNVSEKERLVRRGPLDGSSLYSAYRPLRFSELYGSTKVAGDGIKKAILANNGKLPNPAIAFTGPSGTGKTTLAHIIALSLNCLSLIEDEEGQKIEPCLECARCKGILERAFEGTNPFYIVRNSANMKVDDVINMVTTDINGGTSLVSRKGGTKVLCLEEAHNLTPKGIENLLLPVENTLTNPKRPRIHLFLTSSDSDSLFSNKAWKSRILEINLQKWTAQDIFNILIDINKNEYLIRKRPKINRDVLQQIIEKSDSSLRYSITLLQGILEQADSSKDIITLEDTGLILGINKSFTIIDNFVDYMINGNKKKCYEILNNAILRNNVSFEDIGIQVVRKLTRKGVQLLVRDYEKGRKLMKMAKAFNDTIGNSLYQDRFTIVSLATVAALEED